jgi:two-component system chemotaxis response regulator CheY
MASWSIFIVDDSATARSQLRVVFEAKGANVIEAANGQEGLWRARAQRMDLIFSDVHMPVMDGLQMIQELRKLPEYRTTPIFVLTSDATVTRAAEGKKAGASTWITKPIAPELLWKVVEKALFYRLPTSGTPGSAELSSTQNSGK